MIDVEEGAGVELTAEMIRAQLDLMVRDEVFRSSKRSIAFLRYVVEQTLNGSADQIKERTIGVEVFARKPSYDTNLDLSRPRTLGAPYLARFSRDMGFHCPILATSEFASSLKANGQDSWNPTSRKKRARYGAPRVRWQSEFLIGVFSQPRTGGWSNLSKVRNGFLLPPRPVYTSPRKLPIIRHQEREEYVQAIPRTSSIWFRRGTRYFAKEMVAAQGTRIE